MSVNNERTPLLNEARRTIENNAPSKGERIKVAQVVGALEAGKLPSQDQISKMLSIAINSDTLKAGGGVNTKTARLGSEGQEVLDNLKGVLRAVKKWGEEKNGDDLIQNLFYNAATADVDIDIDTPNAPSQRELSKDGRRAIESFRSIASLLVTSPAFRQLASDFILVSRDIFADAASAVADTAKDAAEKSRPSEKERKEGVDLDKVQQKGKQAVKQAQSQSKQRQAKDDLWSELEAVRDYVDDKLPEGDEARDKAVERLQAIITQAQSNDEYKRSISTLVGLVKKYVHKAEEALDETAQKTDVNDEDEKIQQAGRDLKAFIEKVSNKSVDDLIDASQKVGQDVQGNEKLSAYFSELENFVHRLLYQPGYVASRGAYRKASQMYDDAQSLIAENDEWKQDASRLQKELEGLVNGISNDQSTNQLVHSLEKLGESVASAGQIGLGSLKAEGRGLYRDFVNIIVPRLVGLLQEIPVPRIEFKSEDVDLVVDDVKLESVSFIPRSVRVVQNNDLRFEQGYATYASDYDASIRLRVEGINFKASNIAFWVNKKTGFMPFEDAGLLDIDFGAQGINFDVTLDNADEDDQETFFKIQDVHVWMNDFDFQIRENSASFAAWFARPIVRAFVKRNLTSAIESQIAEYVRQLDFRLYGVQQRAIAATNAKPTVSNFINAIARDSIFPQSNSGPVKVKQTGVTKYGKRGEYVLHVGVVDELFPNQPPSRLSNSRRQLLKARAQATARQARGAADQFNKGASNVKGAADGAAGKAKQEASDLDAKRKEQRLRESKSEGWRSDAFNV